jgi:hypothetical protein
MKRVFTKYSAKKLGKGCVCIPEHYDVIKESAFSNVLRLTGIAINAGVSSIEKEAFYRCENLKTAVIPNSVVSIGKSAFEKCRSLTDIIIPSRLAFIEDRVFYGCKNLENAKISIGVVSIGRQAFAKCKKLKRIIIPESVVHIGEEAFWGCKKLKHIMIKGYSVNIEPAAFDAVSFKAEFTAKSNAVKKSLIDAGVEAGRVTVQDEVYASDEKPPIPGLKPLCKKAMMTSRDVNNNEILYYIEAWDTQLITDAVCEYLVNNADSCRLVPDMHYTDYVVQVIFRFEPGNELPHLDSLYNIFRGLTGHVPDLKNIIVLMRLDEEAVKEYNLPYDGRFPLNQDLYPKLGAHLSLYYR